MLQISKKNTLIIEGKKSSSISLFSNKEYFDEYIIIGTTKLVIMPKNKLNFIVQDVVNYNSTTEVKLLHTISLGIQYKFNKKF